MAIVNHGRYRRSNSGRRRGRMTEAEALRVWNEAARLYREGKNDVEIAEEVGISSAGICRWRKRTFRPANAVNQWR